jgi:nucleoid DNA-binding protein
MSEAMIQKQIERARKAGERALQESPRVVSVDFQEDDRLLVLNMQNGLSVRIPVDELQGLSRAPWADVKKAKIAEQGLALHWDSLDVHFTVPGLVKGVYGTSEWMKEIGRKGGHATSLKKRRAAQVNGKRGGRPRKEVRQDNDHKAVTKQVLVESIAEDTGLSTADVRTVIDHMLRKVASNVNEGKKVQLTGFGTFEVRERKARSGVVPGSTQKISVPKTEAVFVPSPRGFKNKGKQ